MKFQNSSRHTQEHSRQQRITEAGNLDFKSVDEKTQL